VAGGYATPVRGPPPERTLEADPRRSYDPVRRYANEIGTYQKLLDARDNCQPPPSTAIDWTVSDRVPQFVVVALTIERRHHPVSIDSCKSKQQQVTLCRHPGSSLLRQKPLLQKNFRRFRALMHLRALRNPSARVTAISLSRPNADLRFRRCRTLDPAGVPLPILHARTQGLGFAVQLSWRPRRRDSFSVSNRVG
jgi:hypothetical protein